MVVGAGDYPLSLSSPLILTKEVQCLINVSDYVSPNMSQDNVSGYVSGYVSILRRRSNQWR